MARDERTFIRKLDYSVWHRPRSIRRFLQGFDFDKHRIQFYESQWYIEYSDPWKKDVADKLGMIDVDHVFIDGKHWADRGPVALIESAETSFNNVMEIKNKPATILANLGKLAKIPTFVVQYHLADYPNPAYPNYQDIDWFFVRMLWPGDDEKWIAKTPHDYAHFLVDIRMKRGQSSPQQMTFTPMKPYRIDQQTGD